MIMNFPCLDCFIAQMGIQTPSGAAQQVQPQAPKSTFLESIKARVVQAHPIPAPKPQKVTDLTICQVCMKLNGRMCTRGPCARVKARSLDWRSKEIEFLDDHNDYRYRNLRQGTMCTFFDYQDRESYGGIDNANRLYISKPAKQKSAHYMYLFMLWAPIHCEGCGSEFIPIYDYDNQRPTRSGNEVVCSCPFCGWWSKNWKEIFKMKVWDYVLKEPEEMRRIIKWSIPQES